MVDNSLQQCKIINNPTKYHIASQIIKIQQDVEATLIIKLMMRIGWHIGTVKSLLFKISRDMHGLYMFLCISRYIKLSDLSLND